MKKNLLILAGIVSIFTAPVLAFAKHHDAFDGQEISDDSEIIDVEASADSDDVLAVTKNDTSLKAAIESAYLKNPELAAQQRAFQSSVEQVPQAFSGMLPVISGNYQRGEQRTRSAGADWSDSDAETQGLSATQPLFRGGTTYANVKSARRQVDAAIARLQQVEQSVLLQAITAYMDLVRADSVLGLSEKTRDVLASQLEAATQRFAVGEDTRTDVAQSESRLALAKSDVINAKGSVASARAVYKEVVGLNPENIQMPNILPNIPSTVEKVVEIALERSPIIKEITNLKDSADYVVDANIGTLLPSIDLQGSMSRQEGIGVFGDTDFDQDQLVLSASVPFYTGGRRHSLVRQAKENYQQRRFQLLDVQDQVRRQAVSAWEDLEASKATIISNQAAVDAATVALDGVRQEQQYGSRTTLDVLDAERELFNAQVQLVIAERNKVVALYSLLAIMGELTADNMSLDVPIYDAEGYYDDTEYQFIGF